MIQIPNTTRSNFLLGVLAVTAVVLALGLGAVVPCMAAQAGPPPARAGEFNTPAFCQCTVPLSGEALCRNQPTNRGVDSRHSETGTLRVFESGTIGINLLSWLTLLCGRLPAAAPLPLHVLFCTWLL
jgi:hypothetical protein